MSALLHRFIALENVVHRLLGPAQHLGPAVSVGAVSLVFGALKFFPGVSPAEETSGRADSHAPRSIVG